MSVSKKVIKELTGKISGLSKEDQELFYDILSAKAKDGKITIEVVGEDDEDEDIFGRRKSRGKGRSRRAKGRGGKSKASIGEIIGGIGGLFVGLGKEVINLTMKLTDSWRKIDDATTQFARKHGMSAQAENQYRKHSISRYNDLTIGADFNISTEDLAGLESSIISATGRRTGIANSELRDLAGTTKFFGEGETSKLIGKLDEFGIGISDATAMAHELYKDSVETGVDLETYTKNFLENIEMAQTYNFADGVDGVKSMAKKATELKFSLKSAASFADKVGNLQGAIETGSKLQALGGSFAQFSNPLSMMAESLTDTDALYDRMADMFGSLGKFDKKTGQVKINSVDKRRAKAAAEAMGVSYDDMMKGATTKVKRNEMEKALRAAPTNISPELKELLLNTGTFQDGKAGYVDKNGKFKDLSKITENDKEELQALGRTDSQNMAEAAMGLKSVNETLSGMQLQQEAVKAQVADKLMGEQLEKLTKVTGEELMPLIKGWAVFSMGLDIFGAIANGVNILINFLSLFKGGIGLGRGFGGRGAGKGGRGGGKGKGGRGKGGGNGKGHGKGGKGRSKGKGHGKGRGKGKVRGKGGSTNDAIKGGAKGGKGSGTAVKGAKGIKGVGQTLKGASKVAKGAGVIASVAGLASDGAEVYDAYKNGGRHEQAEKTSQLTGNAIGTTIGAVFGGPVGAALGGWIGSTAGKWIGKGINAITDHSRKKAREKFGFGDELQGDYSKKQLKALNLLLADGKLVAEEVAKLDKKLKKKLEESGDLERFYSEDDQSTQFNFSKGGIVPGNMMSGDKIRAGVNSREMILNPAQQSNLFNMINSTVGSVVKPNLEAFQKPLSVAPSSPSFQAQPVQKIELSPLKIDINGSIKLTGKNGDVDITKDLLNDKSFIKSITDAIVKQININDNTRYMADKR